MRSVIEKVHTFCKDKHRSNVLAIILQMSRILKFYLRTSVSIQPRTSVEAAHHKNQKTAFYNAETQATNEAELLISNVITVIVKPHIPEI